MDIDQKTLKDLLVKPGYISLEEFSSANQRAKRKEKELIDELIDKDLIKDEQLGKLIAEFFDYNFINLRQEKIVEKTLIQIPETVARSRGVIVFFIDKKTVKIGMTNPGDLEIKHILERQFEQDFQIFMITKRDLEEALKNYRKSLDKQITSKFEEYSSGKLADEKKDKLIVEVVNLLLEYGYNDNASDIHIEPYDDKVIIRFRIDGVMHSVLELKKEFLDSIVMRIKILARLRTDQHRAAQDGKFKYKFEKNTMNVRISVIPVTGGENIVMRLLNEKSEQLSLNSLGLSVDNLDTVKEAINYPHGMILVTGPTGCGKTSTIYEIIKILNTEKVHVASIEDPVEYNVEGVSQIQVDQKTNLTFAQGLRAIVRQDPDIILIGEIRDTETAQIAVNSAMTGHLVLSTLHTNDSATTLPRLLDMGIESFLVASTINIIIAQRLVRKICEKCRYSYQLSKEELSIFGKQSAINELIQKKYNKNLVEMTFYKGAGCKVCASTGYRGRIGIFEILKMEETIKDLVVAQATSDKISKFAQINGMVTMFEDGIDKVVNGATTIDEILRVVQTES